MDLTGAIVGMGPLGLLLAVFVGLLTVLWVIVPLAVFGLRRRVEDLRGELARTREALLAEQRRTNELLSRSGAAGPPTVPSQPVPADAGRADAVPAQASRRPLVARRD